MFAKQTLMSASLVVVLAGWPVIAHADPESPVEHRDDEARPPTGRFEIGAGFTSDEGFIARARVAQDSLFGSGHALALDARLSALGQRFALGYATPTSDTGLQLSAELFNERRQLPGFVRQGAGTGLTLSQQLGSNLRAFVGYRYEIVDVDGDFTIGRGVSPPESSPLIGGTISSLRAGLVYSTLDQPVLPLRGTSAGAIYEIADSSLGSDFAFDRAHTWISHHRPLGPLTLHLGGSLTHLTSRDGSPIPRSERLFLDGSPDIRGFAPGDLGPVDGYGTPLGALTKVTARAELEVPLISRIGLSAVGFFDAGAMLDDRGGALGRSVGVGLMWRTPIGPLRFDWAVPLDGNGTPQFVFGVGGSW